MTAPLQRVSRLAFRDGIVSEGQRAIPEETAIAMVYDGGSHAVMMATPDDIEDFALGFSLTEGIIASPADITDFEIVPQENGIEARLWLKPERAQALAARRRMIAGPTGCGLCGIDSLSEALRAPRPVQSSARFTPADIEAALASLAPAQVLNRETRAVHAAGFWTKGEGLVALREDVGRHNALDKLAGALAGSLPGAQASSPATETATMPKDAGETPAIPGNGIIVLTSRISVELIQKTAMIGAPVIVAVSAPTALALRLADEAGITLIGVARGDGFEVFTHPHRIVPEPLSHVA